MANMIKTTELFYPAIQAIAGPYTFRKAVEVEIFSEKKSYFDWAKIRFTPEFQPKINLTRKEPGSIHLGYNGSLREVFQGYVAKEYNSGGYVDEITLKDKMILLEETFVTNTFLDATPQDMISFGLARAGVSDYKLSSTIYPSKKVVPVYSKNVVSMIKEIHAIWEIKEDFFFSDGVFYWGELPTQDEIYQFEYAKNIISLERPLNQWELVTVSMPFVKHSHKIQLTHPRVSGEFEIQKMHFHTNETGFIRTTLYF